MSADLTTPSARPDRDALAGRTDVLDKVGVLRSLPDDVHATTAMVAEFYEVDDATVRQVVQRNREEFDDDGYEVVPRGEVSDKLSLTPDELGMPRNAGSLALFPRRAVLRIGMLLRDSPIARLVRDYLLNAEQSAREDEDVLIHRALTVSARRIAELNQFKRAIEGGDGLTLTAFHKKYFSSVREIDFFAHLYTRKWLINQRGKGSIRTSGPRAGTRRDGSEHRHPTFKGKPFMYLHGSKGADEHRYENTRVRPGSYELQLRDRLVSEGLSANENTAGVFELESAK